MLKMVTKITPRLYQVTGYFGTEENTFIFTDIEAATYMMSELASSNNCLTISIEYADEAIEGVVDWISSCEL
jgi:hypothetical protein